MKKCVIYGSYGYSGNLIAEVASTSGKPVLLSGRNEKKLAEQASRLGLNYQKASLESDGEMDALLRDASVVIHCAGPFTYTWKPMAKACLRNRCNYLDITGEIDVFESLKRLGSKFEEKQLMAMPGVGFDVVPTDCVASMLKKELPDANRLELAFWSFRSGVSQGTAKTIIENLGKGGLIRESGKLKRVPAAFKNKTIHFGDRSSKAVSIPWGDISTAYTSTEIENIVVYMAAPKRLIRLMKLSNYIKPILRANWLKTYLTRKVEQKPAGPSREELKKGKALIWGRAENRKGESREIAIQTADGYRLTSETAWLIAVKVMNENFRPGYQTPSLVYGPELIFESRMTEKVS